MNTDNNTTENSHSIPLELSAELLKEEIIEKFVKDNRINYVVLTLNHKYKKKNFICPMSAAEKINWAVTIEKIAKSLRTGGISPDHILMIEDVLNTNYEIVIGVVEPNQGDYASTNGKKKEVCYIHKFTANGDMSLHDSVVFTDSGQSAFVYRSLSNANSCQYSIYSISTCWKCCNIFSCICIISILYRNIFISNFNL